MKLLPLVCFACAIPAAAQDITTNLIGYYTFEGNANDQSGRGNHGTLDGTYQFFTNGLVGRGLKVIGDNSLIYAGGGHMVFPEFGATMNNGFTVSLWVRDEVLGSYPVEGQSYISFGIGDSPTFGISVNSAERRILFFGNNGLNKSSYDIFRAINWPGDTTVWKHLVLTYAPGRIAAYYNGVKVGEGAITVNAFPAGKSGLGRGWWGQFGASAARMTALYDNVRIYNRALTEADVRLLNQVDPLATAQSTSPTIFTAPASQTVASGQTANFSVVATGAGILSFQWRKNDVPIVGATNMTFAVIDAKTTDAGAYSVTISNSFGSITSPAATLTVQPPPAPPAPLVPGKLINIATRGVAGSDTNALVGGFSIRGETPVKVLIRGVGPTLAAFGVPGVLADPRIVLFQGSQQISANDNWGDLNPVEVAQASNAVGAFALSSPRDAAMLVTLGTGAYTVNLTGRDAVTGVALLEVYEVP